MRIIIIAVALLSLVACTSTTVLSPTATPTPEAVRTPMPSESPTNTPTPIATTVPTIPPSFTPSASDGPTSTPTAYPVTPTSTSQPTFTPTPALPAATPVNPPPTLDGDAGTETLPVVLDCWAFGQPTSIAFEEDGSSGFAYVTTRSGIVILDVTQADSPTMVESLVVGEGETRAIHVHGSLMFVSYGGGNIAVYDLHNPLAPTLLSRFTVPVAVRVGDIKARGNHIFIVGGSVSIVDISDPTSPRMVGAFSENVERLALRDDLLLTAAHGNGLGVYDVSDPTNPSELGSLPPCPSRGFTIATIMDVAADDQGVVVADGNCGVRRLDLTDPTNPIETDHVLDYAQRVELRDGLVIARGDASIVTFSMDAGGGVSILGEAEISLSNIDFGFVGDLVYVLAQEGGLQIIDTTDATMPVVHLAFGGNPPGYMVLEGDLLFAVTNGNQENGLWVLDVSRPDHLEVLSYTSLPDMAWWVTVHDGVALVATGGGIVVLDVSMPEDPHIVKTFGSERISRVTVIDETLAFAVLDDRSVHQLLLEDWLPIEIGEQLNVGNRALSVQYENGILFVGTFDGLFLLSVSDTGEAEVLSSFQSEDGRPEDVEVIGEVAYVVGGNMGFWILDISDPTAPKRVEWKAGNEYRDTQSVQSEGNWLLAAGDRGVSLFDISEPASPVEIWRREEPYAQAVAMGGGKAFGVARGQLLSLAIP